MRYQYNEYLFSDITHHTRFEEAGMRPVENAQAPGQQGCGLNPSGRWPDRIQQSMGRDASGHVLYEPAVGTNGLRPNEYIQYDQKTDLPTGQVNGPYNGTVANEQSNGVAPYTSPNAVINPSTGNLLNPKSTPTVVTPFNPETINPNTIPQFQEMFNYPYKPSNQYHTYDMDGILADMEKQARAAGINLRSIGLDTKTLGI
jgi:hypothetical protein